MPRSGGSSCSHVHISSSLGLKEYRFCAAVLLNGVSFLGGEKVEYSIRKLAQLAGISTRTLRYYDEIGLLIPARIGSNGYRVYGSKEVDLLQQILFYREMGLSLDEIKKIVLSKDFDAKGALESHLLSLLGKREQLSRLIETVEKSISAMKGETDMKDKEKFAGFKAKMLRENEEKYGEEIRKHYGEATVTASNDQFQKMTPEQYAAMEKLTDMLHKTLKEAYQQGDPSGELAQKACEMHKQWLLYFWSHYFKEAHRGIAQMYVDDPRFTEYYDQIAEGCAAFLRDALLIYCR